MSANLVAAVLSYGSSAASIPIVYRTLGTNAYRNYVVALAIAGVLSISDLGLSPHAVYRLQDLPEEQRSSLVHHFRSLWLAISGILAAGAILCSFVGVFSSLGSGGLLSAVLFSVVRTRFGLETSISQALGSFEWASLVQGFASALTSLLLILTVQFFDAITILLSVQAMLYVAATIVVMARRSDLVRNASVQIEPPAFNKGWKLPKKVELLRSSMPLGLSSIGGLLFSHGDKLILVLLLSKEDTAKYAVLMSIAYFIHHATTAICQPVQFIELTRKNVLGSKTLKKYALINSLAVGFAASVASIFARPILSLAIAESTSETVNLFKIAVWSVAFYSLAVVPYFIGIRFGENRRLLECALLGSFASSLACIFLAKHFGLKGALASNALYALSAIPLVPVFTGRWEITRIHLQLVGPAITFAALVLLGSQVGLWS